MHEPGDQQIDDLTLALLYVSSWIEGKAPFQARRSWKGYPFDALDRLREQDLISDSGSRAKSVYFTDEGEAAAKEALARLGIAVDMAQ
ncbi:MAG: DUF6429 family protein [Phycisphaerales bacterium JB039]